MRINVRKDRLFVFAIFLIAGLRAFSPLEVQAQNETIPQSEPTPCALKIFVNDPFAQIYVDEQRIGAQPQMIACSDKEKSIVIKSSDGQIFSRLMQSKTEFDLSNTTLNVVFHRKVDGYSYNEGGHFRGLSVKSSFSNSNGPSHSGQSYPNTSAAHSPSAQEIQLRPPRETSSTVANESHALSAVVGATPFYIQVYSLRHFEAAKVKQELDRYLNLGMSPHNISVCHQQTSPEASKWSVVFMGPFHDKAAALQVQKKIGGSSFLVNNPGCKGELTQVGR